MRLFTGVPQSEQRTLRAPTYINSGPLKQANYKKESFITYIERAFFWCQAEVSSSDGLEIQRGTVIFRNWKKSEDKVNQSVCQSVSWSIILFITHLSVHLLVSSLVPQHVNPLVSSESWTTCGSPEDYLRIILRLSIVRA